jgi:putative ABC transport system permease protein
MKKSNIRRSASFWEAGRIAVDSLNKNKLRSFLTLLGIILATTTLIAVMSFVQGMNVYIATKLSDMGSDGFRVVRMAFIGNWDPKKFVEAQRRNPELNVAEYEFIRDNTTMLKDIGMETWRRATVAFSGTTLQGVDLEGITENIPGMSNIEVGTGRAISASEVSRHAPVAFIGSDIQKKFFEGRDALGQTVQIDSIPFQVIGVAKEQGSVFGQSQDNFVMVPIYAFFKTWGVRNNEFTFMCKAIDPAHIDEAQDETRMLLRAYRHLKPGEDDTFMMFASDTFAQAWQKLTGAIAAMAIGIVSVFLIVGGIVIMNIMLAVVTERTHEIGIRKSLGARRQDILNQFLVESAVLAATGGLTGVIVAYLLTVVVRNATPLPMEMPVFAVILGVGLSAAVGLFFGIYPARQAAKLDPIVALHEEN